MANTPMQRLEDYHQNTLEWVQNALQTSFDAYTGDDFAWPEMVEYRKRLEHVQSLLRLPFPPTLLKAIEDERAEEAEMEDRADANSL